MFRDPRFPRRCYMNKLLATLGATVGGWIGWYVGNFAGIFMAFVVSMIGTGAGIYFAKRLADQWLG